LERKKNLKIIVSKKKQKIILFRTYKKDLPIIFIILVLNDELEYFKESYLYKDDIDEYYIP
jgi:hypothetical protein